MQTNLQQVSKDFLVQYSSLEAKYKGLLLVFIISYLSSTFFILNSNLFIYFINDITLFYNVFSSISLLRDINSLRYNYLI